VPLVSPRIQGENTPKKVYSYLDPGRPVLATRLSGTARDLTQREFTPQAFEGKLLRFYNSIEERIREEGLDGQTARLQAGHQGHR
jgi:hypothetical protein